MPPPLTFYVSMPNHTCMYSYMHTSYISIVQMHIHDYIYAYKHYIVRN